MDSGSVPFRPNRAAGVMVHNKPSTHVGGEIFGSARSTGGPRGGRLYLHKAGPMPRPVVPIFTGTLGFARAPDPARDAAARINDAFSATRKVIRRDLDPCLAMASISASKAQGQRRHRCRLRTACRRAHPEGKKAYL